MKTTPISQNRILKFTLGATLVLGLAAGALSYLPAQWVLPGLYSTYAWRSGVHGTTVQTPEGLIDAMEGGSPRTDRLPVLLLHGFGDSKISFVQAAQWVTPEFQVLMPQFPGFGESPKDPKLNHSIRAQVDRVRALLDAKGWSQAHLVGNSMGGHIAAAFALRYPERVGKLILLSPAGLLVDDPIPYRPQTQAIATEADFDAYMGQIFHKTPWVPRPFKMDFITKAAQGFQWLQKVRQEIREGEDYILNDRIAEISAPTLIVWGKHDGVVRAVHAPLWKEKIRNSRLIEFEDAGHSIQYEYPERTGTLIRDELLESTSK